VVRIAIFHIELSTPRLACFICSSLILQGSWSDHCNLNLRKEKKGTPPWYVKVGGHPIESVSHGLWKKKWGGVPSFIKEHQCANFQRTRNRSHLFSIEDSKNPIASRWHETTTSQNKFLYLFYKWKALAHVKSLFSSAKGLSFIFLLSLHLLTLSTFLRAWLSFLV
jgi:hypothetical protein